MEPKMSASATETSEQTGEVTEDSHPAVDAILDAVIRRLAERRLPEATYRLQVITRSRFGMRKISSIIWHRSESAIVTCPPVSKPARARCMDMTSSITIR